MKRAIVAPPTLASAALSELKAWLGINTSRDDAELTALILTALDLCEGFTGIMPLQSGCEEVLPASGNWQSLATRPVQAITHAAALSTSGQRTALSTDDYQIDFDAEGTGLVRLRRPINDSRIVVTFTAGLAPEWPTLPEPLRHGIMRLAAHQHRQREADKAGNGISPPAAVAALWRPWRRMRIA